MTAVCKKWFWQCLTSQTHSADDYLGTQWQCCYPYHCITGSENYNTSLISRTTTPFKDRAYEDIVWGLEASVLNLLLIPKWDCDVNIIASSHPYGAVASAPTSENIHSISHSLQFSASVWSVAGRLAGHSWPLFNFGCANSANQNSNPLCLRMDKSLFCAISMLCSVMY